MAVLYWHLVLRVVTNGVITGHVLRVMGRCLKCYWRMENVCEWCYMWYLLGVFARNWHCGAGSSPHGPTRLKLLRSHDVLPDT